MKSLLKTWKRYRRTRGVRREALTLLLCLALGFLLMPALIWLVGSRTLGAYANGGLFGLWRDYLILGPYAAVWLWRTLRWAWRR
jgi:hypothetical protein